MVLKGKFSDGRLCFHELHLANDELIIHSEFHSHL